MAVSPLLFVSQKETFYFCLTKIKSEVLMLLNLKTGVATPHFLLL
jgi:hypothetical protein